MPIIYGMVGGRDHRNRQPLAHLEDELNLKSKICIKCGVIKPITDFSVDRRMASGRSSICSSCENDERRLELDHSKERREIGKRIEEVIRESGFTEEEAARKCDVSVNTLKYWINGRSLIRTDCLIVFCRIFEVSSDWLLGLSSVKVLEK